jgi:hypothetical protein
MHTRGTLFGIRGIRILCSLRFTSPLPRGWQRSRNRQRWEPVISAVLIHAFSLHLSNETGWFGHSHSVVSKPVTPRKHSHPVVPSPRGLQHWNPGTRHQHTFSHSRHDPQAQALLFISIPILLVKPTSLSLPSHRPIFSPLPADIMALRTRHEDLRCQSARL